jgi:hypothetical protein
MKELFKKYAINVILSISSGAVGTTAVLYYDNISQVFTCIGEVQWQSKD